MAHAIDVILFLLDAARAGEVAGRTLLQKEAYFANETAHLGLEFNAHFYGPFSRQVSEALDSLVASGLIQEEVEEFSPSRATLWERRRYTYRLADQGKQLVGKVKERLGQAGSKIKKVVESIEKANLTRDYMALAAASKVHYIVKRSGKPLHVSRIPAEAKRVGWNLTEAEIKRVITFLEFLGLVKTVKTS